MDLLADSVVSLLVGLSVGIMVAWDVGMTFGPFVGWLMA